MVEYSIVIPVFRSAESLRELYERITKVFQDITFHYEIILVDDASPDDSWTIMQQLRAKDQRVKIIQHTRNFGQHKAILCGLYHSKGDFAITIDDDLQHPPEEIPKLIECIRNSDEIDVVMGSYKVKQHSRFRNFGSKIINLIISYVFHKRRDLKLTGFRIIRRSVADELVNVRTHSPRINSMLLGITNRITNVKVAHHSRRYGRTGYTFSRMVSDALDTILSHSSLPLQIMSFMGFGSMLLSVVLSIRYLHQYFFDGVSVAGWTTTILLLLFFSGVLLFSLGIVGEYLIRILREVQGASRSIIRKKEI